MRNRKRLCLGGMGSRKMICLYNPSSKAMSQDCFNAYYPGAFYFWGQGFCPRKSNPLSDQSSRAHSGAYWMCVEGKKGHCFRG